MSLNQSMSIALGSMKNNQYALTVVSQNIANINTEGYVRQKVNFATNQSTTSCDDVISTIKGMNGARIDSLTDYIDDAAFNDLIDKNADANYYGKLSDVLGELEGISDDLGNSGLNAVLSDFYTASANLEKYPADVAMRQQFVFAAQNIAEKFNDLSDRYNSLKSSKIDTIQFDVSRINTLFNTLAQANQTYLDTDGSPGAKNDINNVLKELSNYTNVVTKTNSNGTVNLYIGNNAVVEGTQVNYNLGVNIDSTSENTVNFKLTSTVDKDFVIKNDVTEAFQSGTMKAYIDVVNGTGGKYTNINDMLSSLDKAASAFATAMNEIQTYDDGENVFAASITTDPATGNLILEKATNPIYTTSDGSDTFNASNIKINTDIANNPLLVAAARIDLSKFKYEDEDGNEVIDEDWRKAIGNSDNATEFYKLQNKKICSYDGSEPNNCTLSDYLLYNASKAGAETASADSMAETYTDIANSAAENYSNLIGVNLDEELADMIKYQRAYEASAKLFTVIDSITATIIGMV